MTKILLKRVLPTIVAAAIITLGSLWLYGFLGVKCGWVGVTDYNGLNAISHSGAEAAGGVGAIMKAKVGL